MPRPTSQTLTERESQLMEILWRLGPATAEAIRAEIPDEPHDSTVRTLLRILQRKGYVRIRGRQPAVYEAKVARQEAQSAATQSLLSRLFGGSAEALVLRLVEDEQLTAEQIQSLRKKVAKRKGGKS
jgi:BlaI family transcriptional regulator, penicillinase repressor